MQARSQLEPPCHDDARLLLEGAAIVPSEIVRVDPDAIVYTLEDGRVMTAWLSREQDRVRVVSEPGMPAWPSQAD